MVRLARSATIGPRGSVTIHWLYWLPAAREDHCALPRDRRRTADRALSQSLADAIARCMSIRSDRVSDAWHALKTSNTIWRSSTACCPMGTRTHRHGVKPVAGTAGYHHADRKGYQGRRDRRASTAERMIILASRSSRMNSSPACAASAAAAAAHSFSRCCRSETWSCTSAATRPSWPTRRSPAAAARSPDPWRIVDAHATASSRRTALIEEIYGFDDEIEINTRWRRRSRGFARSCASLAAMSRSAACAASAMCSEWRRADDVDRPDVCARSAPRRNGHLSRHDHHCRLAVPVTRVQQPVVCRVAAGIYTTPLSSIPAAR